MDCDLIQILMSHLDDTKTIELEMFSVTAAIYPDNVKVVDKYTKQVKTFGMLSSLERALIAYISVKELILDDKDGEH